MKNDVIDVKAEEDTSVVVHEQLTEDEAWSLATKDAPTSFVEEEVSKNVTIKKGSFVYEGTTIGATMDVIILGDIFENAYYAEEYDSSNPTPPDCFAIGSSEETMIPHDNAASPESETCAGCWANEFGSGEKGAGKVCKNRRKLAWIPYTGRGVKGSETILTVMLSPTSLKSWKKYKSKSKALYGRDPFGIATRLKVVSDPGGDYDMIEEEYIESLPATDISPIMSLMPAAKELLESTYPNLSSSTKEAVEAESSGSRPSKRK